MSFSSPRHRALWFTAFAVALGGGWMAGRSALTSPGGSAARKAGAASAHSLKPRVEAGSPAERWVADVKNATAAQFPALFEALFAVFPASDDRHEAALRFLLGAWMARDAEAALAFVLTRKSPAGLTEHAAEIMGRMQPEKMLELMEKPEAGDLPERFADTAMEEVARLHPELYLRFDPDGKRGSFHNQWRLAVKQLTLEAPLETVAAWLHRMPDSTASYDTNLILTVAAAWQTRDSAGARRWAEALDSDSTRSIALNGWLSSLARMSPRAALDALPGLRHEFGGDAGTPAPGNSPVVENYGDCRLDVAGQLARQDFSSALREAQRIADCFPLKDYDATHSTLDRVRQWMAKVKIDSLPDDREGLLAGLDEMTRAVGGNETWWREVQTTALAEKIAGWSAEECGTAVRQRLAADANDPAVPVLLERAARADPHGMLEALWVLPLGTRPATARAVFFALPREEQELRMQLLEQWPVAPWTPELTKSLRGEESVYAPVLTRVPFPAEVRAAFAEQWAETDPAAAAAWVSDLPPQAGGRAEEAGAVARAWAAQDEAEASAWVDSLPQGPGRDAAAAALAGVLGPFNPDAARQWALSIQAEKTREEVLEQLDATPAKQFLDDGTTGLMMLIIQPRPGKPATP